MTQSRNTKKSQKNHVTTTTSRKRSQQEQSPTSADTFTTRKKKKGITSNHHDNKELLQQHAPIKRSKRRGGSVSKKSIPVVLASSSSTIPTHYTNEQMEQHIAFCCANCYCDSETNDITSNINTDDIDTTNNPTATNTTKNSKTKLSSKQLIREELIMIQSGDDGLYHRRCCHDLFIWDESWQSPFEAVSNDIVQMMESSYDSSDDDGNDDNTTTTTTTHNNNINVKVEFQTKENTTPATSMMEPKEQRETTTKVITIDELRIIYQEEVIRIHELKYSKNDKLRDFSGELKYNEQYIYNLQRFYCDHPRYQFLQTEPLSLLRTKATTATKLGVNVLNLFGGIGSMIIALKRLQIPIHAVIQVEYDPVANHVYKWNHDSTYNETLQSVLGDDDNLFTPTRMINHVYINCFEDLEKNTKAVIADFESKYGPIDIIVGSPPSFDFIPRIGTMIHTIQKLQQLQYKNHRLYFLIDISHTCSITGQKLPPNMLQIVEKSFNIQWLIRTDALYYSPCRRNCFCISNIPCFVNDSDYIPVVPDNNDDGYIHDDSCFLHHSNIGDIDSNNESTLNDFIHCAHMMCDIKQMERIHPVKVNPFMAMKSSIDIHPAMSVVKRINNQLHCRPYTLEEREKCMGFPVGYVGNAMKELFEQLIKAYGNVSQLQVDYWKTILPQQYHHFGGRPFQLYAKNVDNVLSVHLRLCPPSSFVSLSSSLSSITSTNSNTQHFYNQEEYGKRLIGNSHCIPILEILLRELQHIYGCQGSTISSSTVAPKNNSIHCQDNYSNQKKIYNEYDYSFVWLQKGSTCCNKRQPTI